MSEGYNQIRDRWSVRAGEWLMYAAAYVTRLLTRWVPVWRLSRALGAVGSRLALLIPGVRRRADENLAMIFPEMGRDERRRTVMAAARSFIHLAVEYTHFDQLLRDLTVEVRGMEHLEAAQASGRGAIIVTAHFGNWEAIRIAAKRAGHETGIIYRAFNNRYLDRFTMDLIPDAGAPVVQKGRQGMRQLVQTVMRGGNMMILVDQRNSGAPFIDFLGHPAETVTAAADLALRTGAALIPAYAVRDTEAERFDVVFEEPVTGDDGVEMMAEVNRRIGAWVRAHPDHWLWFHRRWKSTARSRPNA
ncbi:MAG: lysophospholipid acyltransferase family protein [Pseudomonadota bacterium]